MSVVDLVMGVVRMVFIFFAFFYDCEKLNTVVVVIVLVSVMFCICYGGLVIGGEDESDCDGGREYSEALLVEGKYGGFEKISACFYKSNYSNGCAVGIW